MFLKEKGSEYFRVLYESPVENTSFMRIIQVLWRKIQVLCGKNMFSCTLFLWPLV